MPSHAARAETLKAAYAALNRNDISGFVASFDPQIERVELLNLPHVETYRGLEEVKAHVSKGRATWAEGGCEPQRFIPAGDRVIALVHVHVRVQGETQWREGWTADVYTFRNGKVIQFHTFADKQQALEWAGLSPSDFD